MATERKGRDVKRQWGNNEIMVSPADKGSISWHYADGRGYSYVRVSTDNDWAYVVTDEYEGSAMFPNVLIPEVIKELKKLTR